LKFVTVSCTLQYVLLFLQFLLGSGHMIRNISQPAFH
jgi:hypothetical protein